MRFALSPSRCHRVIGLASVRPHESTKLLLGRSSPLTVNCLRATIFSVLLYKGYTSGRRCVTALQSYTAKKRIHRLFSSAKKRYTALM